MKLSHSYSSIKMYENCPYRYYRQRIVKDVVDTGSLATKAGEDTHKAIELRLLEGKPLPITLTKLEDTCKMLEEKEGGLHVEKELVLTEGLKPTGWFDKDAWLRSKLDVFHVSFPDELGERKGVVIDWKTGKRRVDSFQLDVFAAQAFAHYPDITKVTAVLVWLNTMDMDTFEYTIDDLPRLWQEILGKINRINASVDNDKWQVKPSGLCRFCPLHGKCPATD